MHGTEHVEAKNLRNDMCFFVAGMLVMDLDLWEKQGIVKKLGQHTKTVSLLLIQISLCKMSYALF